MKIIHISDLHYGRTGKLTNKLVQKIITIYANNSEKPLVIITGDLVEDGSRKTMSACKEELQRLVDNNFDLLVCPGNHDVKKMGGFLESQKLLKRFNLYFHSLFPKGRNICGDEDNNQLEYPKTFRFGDYFFIGLNTNRTSKKSTPGGMLETSQLHELDALITSIQKEHPNSKLVVFMHHHPFEYEFNINNVITFREMQLFDRNDFIKIIQGRVNVLLFGHVHENLRLTEEEKKYNIGLIQLSVQSEHDENKIQFNEIDLDGLKVTARS